MKQKVLIVEDEFIVANDLQIMLTNADYDVCGIAASVDEAKVLLEKNNPSLVLLDIFLQDNSMGTDLADYLSDKGIAFIYISASTNQSILEKAKATQPYGFLVKPFRKNDLLLMMEIANDKHFHKTKLNEQREVLLKNQLELIASSSLDGNEKWQRIPGIFQALVPFDFMKVTFSDNRQKETDSLNIVRAGFDEYQLLKNDDLKLYVGLSDRASGLFKINKRDTVDRAIYAGDGYKKLLSEVSSERSLQSRFRLESKLDFSLELINGRHVLLSFYSRKPDIYKVIQIELLNKIVSTLAHLFESLESGKNTPETKAQRNGSLNKRVMEDEDDDIPGFHGIVGSNPSLLAVFDKISLVAPVQSTVLILGESGTGKERIAKCIHELSPRKGKPIITVNCAALPKELVESELFGHEKGAFTGAVEKRVGKFAQAEGGTIFLDEIGELPSDVQVKLLRVLQEKEIEPVGGSKAIKVNVRIITATNRHLEKEVAEGRFRLDLYYRLNVFPIEVPPLRERITDISLLARYFIQKISRKIEKQPVSLNPVALKQLEAHQWPGNIRELENLLERTLPIGNIIPSTYD